MLKRNSKDFSHQITQFQALEKAEIVEFRFPEGYIF